jgi:3-deoxy-7-phosphoheptulonate synthase
VRPLITPALLQEWLPTPDAALALVERSRAAISRVLHGQDDRLIVVVGPCSIHDHDQAMEYARALKAQADALQDDLLVVMRVYFEKPRTTVGWKGYINDPHLDGSFAINEGLELARQLLLDVLALGLPVGTEFLDLLSPQFISDLVSWGAIGARTTESQSHRQLASGLSCPVGFKNGTDGGVKVASDAIQAAQAPARLHGHDQDGPGRHLRDARQPRLPRHPARRQAAQLQRRRRGRRLRLLQGRRPARAGDDRREPRQQQQAAPAPDRGGADVGAADRRRATARITGVMIESHLQEGRQDIVPGQPLQPACR